MDESKLLPSSFLDVAVSVKQESLLNPTAKDVQIGSLIDQAFRKRAKKMEPKRHLDFKDGNIRSYSCLLNGHEQIEMLNDFGQMLASMGMFNAKREEIERQTRRRKRKLRLRKLQRS